MHNWPDLFEPTVCKLPELERKIVLSEAATDGMTSENPFLEVAMKQQTPASERVTRFKSRA